ncbi:hypothetical protein BO71DRAFT_401980 [Aspergillus ellipticus CBS 707.79]|uniref:Uncharacterized protein n=1 Tax=Aspergillus ellipticus CBS 707.79 TaxID=1448320 RepID=A0A319DHR8_9EURO|nr:hypothetical protein BO71DRAFT_401980 [Aspergillus ellipticus CBS 707.79]
MMKTWILLLAAVAAVANAAAVNIGASVEPSLGGLEKRQCTSARLPCSLNDDCCSGACLSPTGRCLGP